MQPKEPEGIPTEQEYVWNGVGVAPMTAPSAEIFRMRAEYEHKKTRQTAPVSGESD